MREAIEFVQEFIHKEYAAYQACYLEREDEVFEDAQEAVNQMYAGSLRTRVQRGMEPGEEWIEEGERQLRTIKERLLFQIKEYAHPEYGSLWGCYVSDPQGWIVTDKDGIEAPPYWPDSMDCILYVANRTSRVTGENKLRIIAEYNCTGNKYLYGSLTLDPLGNPVAILQFLPPKDEESKEEYEKDSRLAEQLLTSHKNQPEPEKEKEQQDG